MNNENEVVLTLESIDKAISLLEELHDGKEMSFPDRIKLTGDIGQLVINVRGEQFSATIPGSFARGIWEFQQEIYRAASTALYASADLRKVPKSFFVEYDLVFKVSEGSSDFKADLSGFLTALGNGLSDMDDTKKLIAILGIVFAFALGHYGLGGWERYLETQVEVARIEAEKSREQERTEQILALVTSNPIVQEFSSAVDRGTKHIIKSAPDATSVSIAGSHFNRQEIIDINARASREARESDTLTEKFKILGFKRHEGSDIGRYTLANKDGEISAIMDMSADGVLSEEQIKHFWEAGLSQKPILLSVEVKLVGGVIRQAIITDVHVQNVIEH